MGATTEISWTDSTFNPWWGCARVSAGCKHCYAETFAKRTGHAVWGEGGERRTFGAKHWNEPRKWNANAAAAGKRRRVFCASMADVFEDHPIAAQERPKLWALIAETPWLDWLLLTKRPENVARFAPWGHTWPSNVWLGVTAEDQEAADRRIPILLEAPAVVRFVSAEPLLEAIDLTRVQWPGKHKVDVLRGGAWDCEGWPGFTNHSDMATLDWVIVGGESGPSARPFALTWARSLVKQCAEARVACFMKQMGAVLVEEAPDPTGNFRTYKDRRQFEMYVARIRLASRKGSDMAEWPEDLRVREFPVPR